MRTKTLCCLRNFELFPKIFTIFNFNKNKLEFAIFFIICTFSWYIMRQIILPRNVTPTYKVYKKSCYFVFLCWLRFSTQFFGLNSSSFYHSTLFQILQQFLTISSTFILKTVLDTILLIDIILLFRRKFIWHKKKSGEYRPYYATFSKFSIKSFFVGKCLGTLPFFTISFTYHKTTAKHIHTCFPTVFFDVSSMFSEESWDLFSEKKCYDKCRKNFCSNIPMTIFYMVFW